MNSSDQVLPASRQPVPLAPEVQAEIDARGRSVAEIERDIARRSERLAATIDELTTRIAPRHVARSAVADVRSRIIRPDGRPRAEVVGAVAGALLVVGLLVWRARRD